MNKISLALLIICLTGCMAIFSFDKIKLTNTPIFGGSLSENGQYSAIISRNLDTVYVYNNEKKEVIQIFKHPIKGNNSVAKVIFSKNNKRLLTITHNMLFLWDIKSGQNISANEVNDEIITAELSTNGQYALVSKIGGVVEYIALKANRVTKGFTHADNINSVAISPNNQYALTGSDDNFMVLWDLNNTKVKYKWQLDERVMKVSFIQLDNKTYAFASGFKGSLYLYDIKTGQLSLKTNPKITVNEIININDSTLVLAIQPNIIATWQPFINKKSIKKQSLGHSIWSKRPPVITSISVNNQLQVLLSNGILLRTIWQ